MPGQNPPPVEHRVVAKPEGISTADFIRDYSGRGIVSQDLIHDDLGPVTCISYMIQDASGEYLLQPLAILVTPEQEAKLHAINPEPA
jgi:hypothetical protein